MEPMTAPSNFDLPPNWPTAALSANRSGPDRRVVGSFFQIGDKIGAGSFAEVRVGTHVQTKASDVMGFSWGI